MAKVKGSVLVEFVKMIRADKSGVFEKHLTDQDREIVSSRILATEWYPLETYMNLYKAVVAELAKDDMKVVREWGRHFSDNYYQNVYKHIFKKTDPRTALWNRESMFRNLYDSIEFKVEEVGENESIAVIKTSEPLIEAFYHVTMGVIERALEIVGGKGVKIEFLTKSWEGAPETRFKISWTDWDVPDPSHPKLPHNTETA